MVCIQNLIYNFYVKNATRRKVIKLMTNYNDKRNILDEFKGLPNEKIKEIIQSRCYPFSVLCQNINYDFNMACVLRSMNALGGKKMYYLSNKKHFDRRAAMGTYHYTDIEHIKNINDIKILKNKYFFVGVDNIHNSIDIRYYKYPQDKEILFCFGEEKSSLLPEIVSLCDVIVHINQVGSVRSMNLASAATATMYDFTLKYDNAK